MQPTCFSPPLTATIATPSSDSDLTGDSGSFYCTEMAKGGEKRKKQRDPTNGIEDSPVKVKKSKDKKHKPAKEENGEEPHYEVENSYLGALTKEDKKSSTHHFDLVKGGQGVLLGCRCGSWQHSIPLLVHC